MRDDDQFDRDFANRLADVLRLAERDHGLTPRRIEADTGISRSSQGDYKRGTAIPGNRLVRLLRILPDDLATILIEQSGKRTVAIEREDDTWMDVLCETARLDAEIAEAEASGMTPTQRANLKEHGRRVIAKLQGAIE